MTLKDVHSQVVDIKEILFRHGNKLNNLEGRQKVHSEEIDLLNQHRELHSIELQKHTSIIDNYADILAGIKEVIKDLTAATRHNTDTIFSFKIMAMTAIFMGGGFITFVVFAGGKILKWW